MKFAIILLVCILLLGAIFTAGYEEDKTWNL